MRCSLSSCMLAVANCVCSLLAILASDCEPLLECIKNAADCFADLAADVHDLHCASCSDQACNTSMIFMHCHRMIAHPNSSQRSHTRVSPCIHGFAVLSPIWKDMHSARMAVCNMGILARKPGILTKEFRPRPAQTSKKMAGWTQHILRSGRDVLHYCACIMRCLAS